VLGVESSFTRTTAIGRVASTTSMCELMPSYVNVRNQYFDVTLLQKFDNFFDLRKEKYEEIELSNKLPSHVLMYIRKY
jgi:hypothetical protein